MTIKFELCCIEAKVILTMGVAVVPVALVPVCHAPIYAHSVCGQLAPKTLAITSYCCFVSVGKANLLTKN